MAFVSEKWANVRGDVWNVQYDDKTGEVSHTDNEELLVDPPKPLSYEYICTVLSVLGYGKVAQ